ncbi:MAG: c-type cytochrome [Verrucomicrobiota bacterium]
MGSPLPPKIIRPKSFHRHQHPHARSGRFHLLVLEQRACWEKRPRGIPHKFTGRSTPGPDPRTDVAGPPATTPLPAPGGWAALTDQLRNETTAASLDHLGGVFGDENVLASMRATLVDTGASMKKRQEALQFLKTSGDKKGATHLVSILNEPEFKSSVLPLLGRLNDPTVATALLQILPDLKGADRNTALLSLTSQLIPAKNLLAAIEKNEVDRQQLNSLHVRQMQNLGDSELTNLLTRVWGRVGETSESARESISKYTRLYRDAPLWAHPRKDGQAVYAKLCASCHVMNEKGIGIGLDLTGSHANGVDYFIENIVDPNAVVGESFQLTIVTRKDGTAVSGMCERNQRHTHPPDRYRYGPIPKSDISSREVLEQSMMPAGLLDTLPKKEVIDLLKFLSTKG